MKGIQTSTQNRVTWARYHSTELAVCGIEVVIRACRDFTSSTFLHPFARPALPGVHAPMGALTPERPTLRTGRLQRSPAHEHRSVCRSGLPASRHQTFRPFRLQPPPAAPGAQFWFLYRGLPRVSGRSRSHHDHRDHCVNWASPLPSRLATTTGRIEFVILRTGRSPPVASHLLSQERSYYWLQSSEPKTLARTPTSLIRRAHRRTRWVIVPRLLETHSSIERKRNASRARQHDAERHPPKHWQSQSALSS